jgi:hypothetical protein
MVFDSAVAVVLAIFAWRMAYLGVRVTLNPIRNADRKKKLKREFTAIGIISVALIATQAYRANVAYSNLVKEIRKNQNASVTISTPPTIDRPFFNFTTDSKLDFNTAFKITSNTAKNFRVYPVIWLEDSPPNGHADKDVISRFRVEAAKNMSDRGNDRGPGTGDWFTLSLDLYGHSGSDLVAGKRTIYFLAKGEWNNPSGSDSHLDVCEYLQQPAEILFRGNFIWHNCSIN